MKRVPIALEKEYVALQKKLKPLKEEESRLKKKLGSYYKRGYAFELLTPMAPEKSAFPWKRLCLQLCAKYMTSSQMKTWLASLKKRFPATAVEPFFRASKETVDA